MNNDLISREALKEKMREADAEAIDYEMLVVMYEKLVDNAPTVELKMGRMVNGIIIPVERPQGEWERDDEHSITFDLFKCSQCGFWGHTHFRFCPNCGAGMRGGDKE